MNRFGKDELFRTAIELDLPDLLSFCGASKTINDKVCKRNDIWLYKINKEFPNYRVVSSLSAKEQYEKLYLFNRPAEYIYDTGVFEAFTEEDYTLKGLFNQIIRYHIFTPKILYLLLLSHEKKHDRIFLENNITYINASRKLAKWFNNSFIELKINPRKISLDDLQRIAISLFRKFSKQTIYKFTPPQLKLIEEELVKK